MAAPQERASDRAGRKDQSDLSKQWRDAYQAYSAAHERYRYSPEDESVVEGLVSTYRRVASIWRALASAPETPWWAKTAAVHAADNFEFQANIISVAVVNDEDLHGGDSATSSRD